jgi:hypothetical protein
MQTAVDMAMAATTKFVAYVVTMVDDEDFQDAADGQPPNTTARLHSLQMQPTRQMFKESISDGTLKRMADLYEQAANLKTIVTAMSSAHGVGGGGLTAETLARALHAPADTVIPVPAWQGETDDRTAKMFVTECENHHAITLRKDMSLHDNKRDLAAFIGNHLKSGDVKDSVGASWVAWRNSQVLAGNSDPWPTLDQITAWLDECVTVRQSAAELYDKLKTFKQHSAGLTGYNGYKLAYNKKLNRIVEEGLPIADFLNNIMFLAGVHDSVRRVLGNLTETDNFKALSPAEFQAKVSAKALQKLRTAPTTPSNYKGDRANKYAPYNRRLPNKPKEEEPAEWVAAATWAEDDDTAEEQPSEQEGEPDSDEYPEDDQTIAYHEARVAALYKGRKGGKGGRKGGKGGKGSRGKGGGKGGDRTPMKRCTTCNHPSHSEPTQCFWHADYDDSTVPRPEWAKWTDPMALEEQRQYNSKLPDRYNYE